jgi:hypothetical protein
MLFRQIVDQINMCAERRLGLAALFCSQAFFLWMFFAAEGLEQMAKAGRIAGSPSADVLLTAYKYAAEWRHGMAGEWPLYMPGFFIAAIAIWRRACQRPWRQLSLEWCALLPLAVVFAMSLSPAGLRILMAGFTEQTGLVIVGEPLFFSSIGVLLGVYTLGVWSTFVVCSHRALVRRTIKPLLLPLILGMILGFVRPVTVGDFTALWLSRVMAGDFVAILSLLLIPGVAVSLYRFSAP